MRRSLGGAGRARGMGGGGGGKMITFQRSVVGSGGGGAPPNATGSIGGANAGRPKNVTRKQSSTSFYSSSSPAPFPSLLNFPMAASSAPAWVSSSSTVCSDESEWEYIDMIDDETAARGFYDDSVFGTAPSKDEVHHVVSALQQAKLGEIRKRDVDDGMMISLSESGMDWLEPSHELYTSKMIKRPRSDMVYDAFHLLETEPSVQRMVVSLSSDKAVWDAVLNNDMVKELRGSIDPGVIVGEGEVVCSEGDGDGNILSWIVTFAKTKMMELLDLITMVVSNVFDNKKGEGDNSNGFDGRVKSSFFLSVVVLLVIVLARTKTSTA